jgi:basic membrane protein A
VATGAPSTGQLAVAPSFADLPDPIPRIAIAYDVGGRSAGYNELAWQGAKRAGDVFDAEYKELTAKPDDTDADREERLKVLAGGGYHPIFAIGSTYAGALAKVAPKYPRTWFGILDDGSVNAPNVVGMLFNDEQGAFLVGAAAALTSKSGNVGFVGAARIPLVQKFEAGFTSGARAADPGVKVQVAYLAQPPDAGVSDSANARKAALKMYDAGADVIFAAGGDSGDGVIQAAHERGRWAIGVDSDRYQTADPSVRGAILTSMLKQADVATYTIVMEVAQGVPKDGNNVFGVGLGGVGYATSGGFVDPIKPQLDAFAAKIASGEILVPTKPTADPKAVP